MKIEAPRKEKNIVQCTKWQCYGHTKAYCARPYTRVTCGGEHNTTQCKKIPNTPAKCTLSEEITRPTVKASTCIKIYKEEEAKQQFNQSETLRNHITQELTSTATTSFLPYNPINLQHQFQQTSKPPILKYTYKTSIHPIYQCNFQPS
jgi:hypothetical protein